MQGNVVGEDVGADRAHHLLVGTGKVGTRLEYQPFLAAHSLLTRLVLEWGEGVLARI